MRWKVEINQKIIVLESKPTLLDMRTRHLKVDEQDFSVIRNAQLKCTFIREKATSSFMKVVSHKPMNPGTFQLVQTPGLFQASIQPDHPAFVFAQSSAEDEQKSVHAPMTGKVLKVMVKEGQTCEKDQPLLIIEAMKMENRVLSPMTGTVQSITVKEGQAVNTDDLLIEF